MREKLLEVCPNKIIKIDHVAFIIKSTYPHKRGVLDPALSKIIVKPLRKSSQRQPAKIVSLVPLSRT
jgi:hypothetical protein